MSRELPAPRGPQGSPPAKEGALFDSRVEGPQHRQGMGPGDLWTLMKRHGWIVAATMVVTVGGTALFTWLQAPVWQASALIRIDEQDAGSVAGLFPDLAGESELETEMRVAGTRPILARVVAGQALHFRLAEPVGAVRHFVFPVMDFSRDAQAGEYEISRLGPNRYALRSLDTNGSEKAREFEAGRRVPLAGGAFVLDTDSALSNAGIHPPPGRLIVSVVEFAQAVDDLQEDLVIRRPDREASLFQLAYQHSDRWLARNVVNGVAAAFMAERQTVQKAEARGTLAFLEEQASQIRTELEAAENALQAFREEEQVVALVSEAQQQVERLAELQTQRTSLAAERDALSNLLRTIQASSAPRPDYLRLVAFPTFMRNPTIQDLVQALTEAEQSRISLRERWSENYPGVVALDEQIAQLESRLGDIGQNYLQSLTDQIASLDVVLVQFGSDLEGIPGRELQFARLDRQAALLADLYAMLQQRVKEAEVAAAVEDLSVRVVEPAVLARDPVRPRPALNLSVGVVVGLLLGLGLAFARARADRLIREEDDVGVLLGLSVLSRVPRLPTSRQRSPGETLVAYTDDRSLPAEAYRVLRTNLFYASSNGWGARELAVTSPGSGDGKSVTAGNLAVTLAQQGHRTLLVDADMRRNVQARVFDVEVQPGLSDYLSDGAVFSDLLRETHVDNLSIVPAGPAPAHPAELLGGARVERFLEEARASFDAIVFDAPPILAVADATVLAGRLDGVVLVVRPDRTHREAAAEALHQLRQVRARILGVVVNDANERGRYSYRYAPYYDYHGVDGRQR